MTNYPAVIRNAAAPMENKHLVRNVILVAGGLTATYFAAKAIIKLATPADTRKEVKYQRDELEQYQQSGQDMSFPPSQAETYANGLFTAMDGYGTDWPYIYNTFRKFRNNADYLAVNDAFGTREISSGRLNPEPNYKGNLTGALVSELDEAQLLTLNNIMKSAKIRYRI